VNLRPVAVLPLVALLACTGTTGSELVTFDAYAAGPEDASGPGYSFVTGRGYTVTLHRMRVLVGGLYLNRSVPISGGQSRSCFLPGIYVGEVPSPLLVDVLDSRPQRFPGRGGGTRDLARTGEVWLTGARIDATRDPSVLLDVAGVALRDGVEQPFEARITISENRGPAVLDPARPGADPLCLKRIVSPIPVLLTPAQDGALLLRVDPRGMFANVDFSLLPPPAQPGDPWRFDDADTDQPSTALFAGLRSADGVYRFTFLPSPP
jgi:hypothetical protein